MEKVKKPKVLPSITRTAPVKATSVKKAPTQQVGKQVSRKATATRQPAGQVPVKQVPVRQVPVRQVPVKESVPKQREARTFVPQQTPSEPATIDMSLESSLIGAEYFEDAENMNELNDIDAYLNSEAHVLAEQEILDEYIMENGSEDGYEDMLEDHLLAGMRSGETADILMYDRIRDRIEQAPTLELRQALYAKFAPEIMKGRERSRRLVARIERKRERARALDAQRASLKNKARLRPKDKKKDKDREKEHEGRTKKTIADGYPY